MKKKKLVCFFSGIGILILVIIILIYRSLFGANIKIGKSNQIIYIPTGSSYMQVIDTLKSHLIIKNLKVFEWVSKKKNYQALIKPGRYIIDKNLNYIELVNLLRSGHQTPVKITFTNIRTLNQLAGKLGKLIEADFLQIISYLSDDINYLNDGFDRKNIIALFIPNTYDFYGILYAKGLYNRMLKEYRLFWNNERLAKAKEKGLNSGEVSVLASIVDDEASKPDEKPRIAGVYLNRLKRGSPCKPILQSGLR